MKEKKYRKNLRSKKQQNLQFYHPCSKNKIIGKIYNYILST
jgi:hypothetical protein